MNASLFLARLIGPVMLTVGIALLVNRRAFATMADEFLRSRALMYLSGFIIMPAGLAIVLTHNVWVLHIPVLITLLGWGMAIGGAVRILVPDQVESIGRRFLQHPQALCVAAGIWCAVGLTLCIFGYISH